MKYTFETLIEKLKFDLLTETAKSVYNGTFKEDIYRIPLLVSPGPKSEYRCCVYMERAIIQERLYLIKEGIQAGQDDILRVLPIACDQCPMGGYTVTNSCCGCIGHACTQSCPSGAITFDSERKAHIDKTKCVSCGQCAKACPFGSIYNFRRPCQKACRVNAISMDENLVATIDHTKCINCGACMTKCPFGAINDRTQIVQVINQIVNNKKAKNKKTIVAIIAPSIASQVTRNSIEQVVEGIKLLGFDKVVEAALGADMVAWDEAQELVDHKKLTSSCCPAFVTYIKKYVPELVDKISSSLSPMAQIAKVLKEKDPNCVTVFIGPCTAKKAEIQSPSVKNYVDYVLTFTEARAMLHAKEIDLDKLAGEPLDQATGYGRGFARCGGLSEAVMEVLKEKGCTFNLCSRACDGIDDCIKNINEFKSTNTNLNFLEGMVCEGGCVGGAGSLFHNKLRSKALIDLHAKKSSKKQVKENSK